MYLRRYTLSVWLFQLDILLLSFFIPFFLSLVFPSHNAAVVCLPLPEAFSPTFRSEGTFQSFRGSKSLVLCSFQGTDWAFLTTPCRRNLGSWDLGPSDDGRRQANLDMMMTNIWRPSALFLSHANPKVGPIVLSKPFPLSFCLSLMVKLLNG